MTGLRLATKAKIKRASQAARDNASRLDAEAMNDLTGIYKQALSDIQSHINAYGDDDGIVRVQWLKQLREKSEYVLSELERIEKTALFERMDEVARMGIEPVAEILGAERVNNLINGSVRAVRNFTAADGLQLSDRLWRVNNHAKEVVQRAINSAVVQGHSASQAALEFLRDGVNVPADTRKKIQAASTNKINRLLGQELMTGEGSPYHNARRLFRTEINRAHGTAYQASVYELDDTAGTRFLLSPNHPETDICDMHSKANVYGLGPGVYPKNKSPWPAHPNTLSYEEVVFYDEVTEEDKKGKQSRLDWLKQQPAHRQAKVLGSKQKQKAFEAGLLSQSEITTPWYVLKTRYDKRGIDITFQTIKPVQQVYKPKPETVILDNPFANRDRLTISNKIDANSEIAKYTSSIKLEGANQNTLQSIASGFHTVLGLHGNYVQSIAWTGRRHRRALGLYSRPMGNYSKAGTDQFMFKKSFFQKNYKNKSAEHLAYIERRKEKLSGLKNTLDQRGVDNPDIVKIMERVKAATRWTASSVADDPLFSVVSHESGHAMYYQGLNVPAKFKEALKKHDVTLLDYYRVSEYAATNESELFAEVTAFMAMGKESMIPKNVVKAYVESIQNYRLIE